MAKGKKKGDNSPSKTKEFIAMKKKNSKAEPHNLKMKHALNLLRIQSKRPNSNSWEIVDENWTFDGHEIHRTQGDTGNSQES